VWGVVEERRLILVSFLMTMIFLFLSLARYESTICIQASHPLRDKMHFSLDAVKWSSLCIPAS
jgi:hypothetical protein